MDKAKIVKAKPAKVEPLLPPKEPEAPKLDHQLSNLFENQPLTLKWLKAHQIGTPKWIIKLHKAKTRDGATVPHQTAASPQTTEATAYKTVREGPASRPHLTLL